VTKAATATGGETTGFASTEISPADANNQPVKRFSGNNKIKL